MKPLRKDEASEEDKDRRAEQDFRDGRGATLSEVRAWVESWGTDAERERPRTRPMAKREAGARPA